METSCCNAARRSGQDPFLPFAVGVQDDRGLPIYVDLPTLASLRADRSGGTKAGSGVETLERWLRDRALNDEDGGSEEDWTDVALVFMLRFTSILRLVDYIDPAHA